MKPNTRITQHDKDLNKFLEDAGFVLDHTRKHSNAGCTHNIIGDGVEFDFSACSILGVVSSVYNQGIEAGKLAKVKELLTVLEID